RYSVPPELAAARVIVHQRLGAATIDIGTISGVVLARHQVAEPGLGVTIRDSRHVTALETIALAAAPPGRPHRKKERIPPGTAARRAAMALTSATEPTTVISLAAYETAAKNRNTLQ
ncbi:IS21 family transposase, partial [Demequina sp. TTPB684]|nr:IS21 family transposase [Demequina sp. TTPB684]